VRVAVTGAHGRLGRALVAAFEEAPFIGLSGPIAWGRESFDLDSPGHVTDVLDRDRPEVLVHAAAWTDVDGCARQPELAMARNGAATGTLAEACADRGLDLIVVSTNEVFDGRRTDGRGYRPSDRTNPINAYGASKLAGELAALEAYGREGRGDGKREAGGRGTGGSLGIVRTAWLFGPPGNDFPAKILTAAQRAKVADEPLRLVADEIGSPTYSVDLAEAIAELIGGAAIDGVRHLVNDGAVSRADWARELLRQAGLEAATQDVPASTWPRLSTPPAWAVLEPTPLPGGEPMRSWEAALADYLPSLLRQRSAAGSPG
jgi:dTDP-4-dehydrorhamnose reductase